MKEYMLAIETLSPLHLGNGQEGIIVDAEVTHDELGIPYIPAKRLKGLLYESALEITEMFDEYKKELNLIFGKKDGKGNPFPNSLIRLDNLYIENYESQRASWNYLKQEYKGIFDEADILDTYTQLRFQTKIDRKSGTAKEGSLHNMRVVDADIKFVGKLILDTTDSNCEKLLKLAVSNLRYIGAKRNRGCGHVNCSLKQEIGGENGAKA